MLTGTRRLPWRPTSAPAARRPAAWLPRRGLAWLAAVLAGLLGGGLLLAPPAAADAVRQSQTWVLDALNVQPAWAVTQGQGVVVAVIDSGVNPDVSDLTGSVITGPDFTGVDTPPSNPNWGVHGTWMASLVAGHGHAGGGSGIIGVAPRSRVLSIRVITDKGDPNFAAYEREPASKSQGELAAAIRYAVGHGAGVISMSLGYSLQSRTVRDALQDAYDHNVVVVASAGNSEDLASPDSAGQAPYSFPADYPGVLAVAALSQGGQVASYSSNNLSVQVAAPGSLVPAQGSDGKYWLVTGTSPACALTAGVVALIKSKYPQLTDGELISALTSSTTRASRPAGGYNDQAGFGEVNAGAAMAAAARLAATHVTAGLAAAGHFGGGTAANPRPPIAPRGRAVLVLYCLLGVVGLALLGTGISRLFALRDVPRGDAVLTEPAIGSVLPRIVASPPGRHAAPRGRPENETSSAVEDEP